jgi:MATH domain
VTITHTQTRATPAEGNKLNIMRLRSATDEVATSTASTATSSSSTSTSSGATRTSSRRSLNEQAEDRATTIHSSESHLNPSTTINDDDIVSSIPQQIVNDENHVNHIEGTKGAEDANEGLMNIRGQKRSSAIEALIDNTNDHEVSGVDLPEESADMTTSTDRDTSTNAPQNAARKNPTSHFSNSNGTATSHSLSNRKTEDDLNAEAEDDDEVEDDDGGTDHADESLTPNIVWKPQNVNSTCEFTHTILDYAQKRESGCKKAEYSAITQDELGNRWRLIVYVNGNGRASNHHLSLFLQVADAEDLPFGWKKAVSYVLTLEHPNNAANMSYAKRNPDKTFKLCPKAIDWGWSQFITSDRIQQEGFVKLDTLTVRAQVRR